AVLHQRGRLLRRSRSKVESHQRLCTHQLAPCHEFIRAELVGFDCVPGFVESARTVFLRAYAVEPVVSRNEVTPRVPNDWNSELPDFVHHVLAESICVRQVRTRIVNTFVDRPSQMLQE